MTRQLLVALAIGLAGCGSRGCGPHQPLFYDSAVHIGVNARSTVLLDPALDGNGPGLPLHTAMIAAHTYDIRLNVSGASGGPTHSVFLWQGGYIDVQGEEQPSEYHVVRNGEVLRYRYPVTHSWDGPMAYVFFADAAYAGDNTVTGEIDLEDQEGLFSRLELGPGRTVFLDPLLNGVGDGYAVQNLLFAEQTYDALAMVSGNTGGQTDSVFLWQGGYVDAEGVEHETRYLTLTGDESVPFVLPRTGDGGVPMLYAFLADTTHRDDNAAAGTVRFALQD